MQMEGSILFPWASNPNSSSLQGWRRRDLWFFLSFFDGNRNNQLKVKSGRFSVYTSAALDPNLSHLHAHTHVRKENNALADGMCHWNPCCGLNGFSRQEGKVQGQSSNCRGKIEGNGSQWVVLQILQQVAVVVALYSAATSWVRISLPLFLPSTCVCVWKWMLHEEGGKMTLLCSRREWRP